MGTSVKTAAAVTVTTSETTLIEASLDNCAGGQVAVGIKNTHASVALNSCKVYGRVGDGAWLSLYTAYSTVDNCFLKVFGAPVTLAAGATGIILLNMGGMTDIKVTATTGTSGTAQGWVSVVT